MVLHLCWKKLLRCASNKQSYRSEKRLGIGRRCFEYFYPAIPGESLIFIEVALVKDVAASIQPGLSGVNLGKFLIKRVVDVVKKDMPNICVFATLSPVTGFRQWML
uniref:Malonyl-CoA decarboxylase C-terminal domain-containing protein n=1 Tax=Solanum lycopersicum TaxID=4081 RepID=A0A3Q7EY13_SOLLC